jgi:hypothetical protein
MCVGIICFQEVQEPERDLTAASEGLRFLFGPEKCECLKSILERKSNSVELLAHKYERSYSRRASI